MRKIKRENGIKPLEVRLAATSRVNIKTVKRYTFFLVENRNSRVRMLTMGSMGEYKAWWPSGAGRVESPTIVSCMRKRVGCTL